ncbi:hypothetical protein BN1723_009045, partial [Verticillium longisporum]
MTSHESLTWRQASPGIWQRGTDEIEEFYSTMAVLYEGSGRMFFGITGFLSLSVDVAASQDPAAASEGVRHALQKGWLALRYHHPTLASQVTRDDQGKWTKTYRGCADEQDQNRWLQQTFVTVSNGQTGLEWANSDPPAPQLPTLFVIGPREAQEQTVRYDLVFRSPHDIIDGIGTLMMLNNLVGHASEAYAQGASYRTPALDGSEAANLSPPYRIAANVPAQLSEAQKERLQTVTAQKAQVRADTSVEILALPFREGAQVPGVHKRTALTLSVGETARLLAACKAAGVTPTHVFHAAAAVVDRDLQPVSEAPRRVRYINYILRNERAGCAEPFGTSKHPAALYHSVSGQSLVVDMDITPGKADATTCKEEFHSIVRHMSAFYNEVRNDSEHAVLVPDLWAMGTPELPLAPRPLPVPAPNSHPSVSISSMGRVDTIVSPRTGAFDVLDAWVTGEELGTGLGIFLGSFKGRLCVSAAYNDAWHDEAGVSDFLQRAKDVVWAGMDLGV